MDKKLFDEAFPATVVAPIVESLKKAYSTGLDLHDSERGSNELTFGIGIYHFAKFEICNLIRAKGEPFRLLSKDPTFRFEVGRYELGCYRVGAKASQDIEGAFPGNDGAASNLIERQLWLPNLEPKLENIRKLILAHLGNHETGLEAIYVCVPKREEDGKIVEWGDTHLLWMREERTLLAAKPVTTVQEEKVSPLELRLKNKSKEIPNNG